MPGLRRRLVWTSLRLVGLPALPPPAVGPEAEAGFAAAAAALLAGEAIAVPEPRLDFLRLLAQNRPVVFHGSPRDDLNELSTERRSRDTTAWGNQQAVYASTDPVWAIYFACLRRDRGWTGTKNGSMGQAGGLLYPRRYFFLHNRGSASPDRLGPGSLYLLSPSGFAADEPLAGAIDTAHLVSHEPVKPLARLDVTPDDFPFGDRIRYYRDGEPNWISLLRA
jgi:hypothetical protein